MRHAIIHGNSEIIFIAVIALCGALAGARDLKVYDLHGLPAGGYAVYASAVQEFDGASSSATTTVSWLKQEADGSVWLEFARAEEKKTAAVKVLAAPDGRALKMFSARGQAAAGSSERLPEKATVLADRTGMRDRGSEPVTTAAGAFACRHYELSASEDTRSRNGDLTLVTTVAKQQDIWVSESGDFLGMVKQRTVTTISQRTYLGDRLLPKKSPVRERTETVELQRVARNGAVSRIGK